ncbi:MAG TPA: DUF6454 family protein [Sedimentisphaerales bacterium]|nr:DUF6454 family protein [Sedimentisphaerales bacterium]
MSVEKKMIRVFIIFNRVFYIFLLLALSLTLNCKNGNENSPENALDALFRSRDLELIHQVPLQFVTYHVQGLELTEQFYFVTSVDKEQKRGWLFKIDRQNANLNSKIELTDRTLIHPGGLQFDGHYLWIPNAEYKSQGRTMIYGVDPNSLEICMSFPVNDHIGAIASDGKNLLYGVNWDALHFYTWDFDGHQLNKVDSPTSMAYQDIKYFAGKLLCSGHKDDDSVIDIIDPENWTLVKRIDLPQDVWKNTLSREGMTFDGNLYFLPDDEPDSRIMIFALH